MIIERVNIDKAKAKDTILGASCSGKSYTALLLAYEKIVVIIN